MVGAAAGVVAALALEFVALMTFVGETGGMWTQRFYGTDRVDVVEIFGGHSEISLQAHKRGWLALQPYDREYGCDLLDPKQRDDLRRDLRALRPRLAVVEFPCTMWSQIQALNYGTSQEKRRKLAKLWALEEPLLELTEQIFLDQIAAGDDALAENPWGSAARKRAPIQRLEARPDVYIALSHGCRWKLANPYNGLPLKKPQWWCTTSPELAEELDLRCLGGHAHGECLGGKVAEASGRYTPELARAVLKGLYRLVKRKEPARLERMRAAIEARIRGRRLQSEACLVEMSEQLAKESEVFAASSGEKGLPEEGISFVFEDPAVAKRASVALRYSTRRLHLNTNHSLPTDMARVVRLAGGSNIAVECCKALWCSACAREARPKLQRSASIRPEQLQFNEVEKGDPFCVKDSNGDEFWFFVLADDATGFRMAALVEKYTLEELWKSYEIGWSAWAGPPDRFISDNEAVLVSEEFAKRFGRSGTLWDPTVPYAPWQKGRVEARGDRKSVV
jgi:hypothetical protein